MKLVRCIIFYLTIAVETRNSAQSFMGTHFQLQLIRCLVLAEAAWSPKPVEVVHG